MIKLLVFILKVVIIYYILGLLVIVAGIFWDKKYMRIAEDLAGMI